MQNNLWKIYQIILIFLLFVNLNCKKSEKVNPDEVVKFGILYPKVLCEKIVACIQEELNQLSPTERAEALPFLPNQEKCIEDQREAKVLPIDKKDPLINEITMERLSEVKSCIQGIEKASCELLEDPQSIEGCKELYNIGD